MYKRIKNMYAKFKDWLDSVNELEKQNLEAGIINVLHPFMGVYTHVDQETFRKWKDDKQRAVSKSNKQS